MIILHIIFCFSVTKYQLGKPSFMREFFSRNIISSGLPEEFSLVYTLRARKSPKYPWHVIKIADAKGDAQFLITMNSRKHTLDFSSIDREGELQTVSFVNDRVSVIGHVHHCSRIARFAHCCAVLYS